MSRNENFEQPKPSNENNADYPVRGFGVVVVGLGLAVGALCAYQDITNENAVRAGSTFEGGCDQNIDVIVLADGATARSDPKRVEIDSDESSNSFGNIDLRGEESVEIKTPNGVCESNDENGAWYGVRVVDLKDGAKATDIGIPDVGDDKDGIIWFNHQMALPVSDQTKD